MTDTARPEQRVELSPENRALIERSPVDQQCFLVTRDVATAGLNILLDAARQEGRRQAKGPARALRSQRSAEVADARKARRASIYDRYIGPERPSMKRLALDLGISAGRVKDIIDRERRERRRTIADDRLSRSSHGPFPAD